MPGQAQHRRVCFGAQRAIPGLRGLDGVAGPKHQQVGYRPQRGEMLHRLMRRAVFAKPDGIVRHHVDNADAHQRRQPDRGAAIVGKAEECPAVGDESTVQGDAVHRSRHGMLAHAVMDVAALEESRRTGRCVLACVRFECVRSAEPPSKFGKASAIALITSCDACRVAIFGRSVPKRSRSREIAQRIRAEDAGSAHRERASVTPN